jgi:hypothetical protein
VPLPGDQLLDDRGQLAGGVHARADPTPDGAIGEPGRTRLDV